MSVRKTYNELYPTASMWVSTPGFHQGPVAQDVLRAWGAPQLVHRFQWCQKGAVAIALRVVPSFVEFGPGVLLLWRIGIQGPLPVFGIDPTHTHTCVYIYIYITYNLVQICEYTNICVQGSHQMDSDLRPTASNPRSAHRLRCGLPPFLALQISRHRANNFCTMRCQQ